MMVDDEDNGLMDGLANTVFNSVKTAVGNPLTAAIGGAVIGGSLIGATVSAVSAIKNKRRKSTKKKSRKYKKSYSRKKKRKSYKYARTAGKGKDTSRKRIRMTKNGQPYVIMSNGRARFIKKSSARTSRRRKGGRY